MSSSALLSAASAPSPPNIRLPAAEKLAAVVAPVAPDAGAVTPALRKQALGSATNCSTSLLLSQFTLRRATPAAASGMFSATAVSFSSRTCSSTNCSASMTSWETARRRGGGLLTAKAAGTGGGEGAGLGAPTAAACAALDTEVAAAAAAYAACSTVELSWPHK